MIVPMAESKPYFAVSTIEIPAENVDKVSQVYQRSMNLKLIQCAQAVEFFTKVGQATEEKEPAAKIYRWFKTEGKNEFVFIEK